MLKATRLFMLLLISYVYYIHIPDKEAGIRFFVGTVMLLYVVNHFFIMSGRCNPWQLLTLLFVDSAATASFGFLFTPDTLYLILFGIHALTLFLFTEKRIILVVFSLWFFVCWIGVLIYTYILRIHYKRNYASIFAQEQRSPVDEFSLY